MAKLQQLNVFITDRLAVAAMEIFGALEKTVVESQEEILRCKEENDRLRRLLQEFGYKFDNVTSTVTINHVGELLNLRYRRQNKLIGLAFDYHGFYFFINREVCLKA